MVEMSKELLIRFINNSCTDEELILVKDWIDASEENAKELFELEQTAMFATSLDKDTEAKHRVSAKIRQRIFEEQLSRKRRSRNLVIGWSAAAASVAVIIVTALFLFRTPDVRMLTAYALNETQMVELPDGTKVYLNKGSELRYPETFAKVREVSLSGEGFFEVTHDAEHPFVVEGHYLTIKVLGTEFNFNSNESGANNVSLVTGSVEVSVADNAKEGVVLAPGQKADYDSATGALKVVATNAGIDAAWHDRIIPFEKASIKDIADILTRLYKVNISIDSKIDLSKTYSGVTVYYEDIDSTLVQLSNTLPIDYSISGSLITLKAKRDGR